MSATKRTASKSAPPPPRPSVRRLARHNQILLDLSLRQRLADSDLAGALRQITEAAARGLEVERASVWFASPDCTKIRCADLYERSAGRHSEGVELTAAEYPSYFRALQGQRSIPAHAARTDPRTREFDEGYLVPLGITSMLDAPVRRDGRLIGVVCHEHVGRPRRWRAEDEIFAGSLADFVTLALEVSERREVEGALRGSEQRFRSVINALDDLFFTLDRDQKFVEVFGRGLAKFGVKAGELLGRTVREALSERAGEAHEEPHARALAGERAVYDWELETAKGTLHFQTSLSPITNARGAVTGVVGVGREITTLKRAARERETLRELAEKLIAPVSEKEMARLVAQACRKLFAHDAFFLDLLDEGFLAGRSIHAEDTPPGGREPHEVKGEDRVSPLVRSLAGQGAAKLINRREEPIHNETNPFGYAFRRSLSLLFAPIRWQSKVLGYISSQSYAPYRYGEADLELIGTVGDLCGAILARLRMEEQLRRSEGQLRHAQKMEAVGRLAGGVAHDFNNLLTVVTGYGELLKSLVAAEGPARPYLEDILKAAQRASSLTRQLLAFSRKQVFAARVLDLNLLISASLPLLRTLAGDSVEVLCTLDPALDRVRADPAQIEQVVFNLVANARDALASGGKVFLETSNVERPGAGPQVRLAVRDTGSGMDAETLAHLFEPFFTTKGPGKGSGLGLSTVYGVVKQSGGHVDVASEPGRGTTITILLPRAPESADAAAVEAAGAASPAGGSETVLLVEDADVVRKLAREVLRMKGYQVLEARNGREALAVSGAHGGAIHLLLTDVVMPEMSGPQLAQALGPLRPDTRILFMSGYPEDAMHQQGLLEPGRPFLEKPFTPEKLALKVREVLDAR